MNKDQQTITEEEAHINPLLAMIVEPDSELKEFLVDYVGKKFDKESVTVNMVAETMATDFPEFIFAFAEENFLRGYKQGLDDAELFERTTSENAK
tara:strand:- start:447 stop:731 length:285 start_codon:yes stop_codon:yes gene_type:complete